MIARILVFIAYLTVGSAAASVYEGEVACNTDSMLRLVVEQWVPDEGQGCTLLPVGYAPDSAYMYDAVPGLCDFDHNDQVVMCGAPIKLVRAVEEGKIFFIALGWREQLLADLVEDIETDASEEGDLGSPLFVGIPCEYAACAVITDGPTKYAEEGSAPEFLATLSEE